MTAVEVETPPIVTWYKPEHASPGPNRCYCGSRAVGRTCYWDGTQLTYWYQCGEHMPRAAARFEDGVPS
jgi:hypothetical protein